MFFNTFYELLFFTHFLFQMLFQIFLNILYLSLFIYYYYFQLKPILFQLVAKESISNFSIVNVSM